MHVAKTLFGFQIISLILVSLLVFFTNGLHAVISVILAGVSLIIPSLVFAVLAFRFKGARNAKKIVNHFYLGEALKIGCSVCLFTLIFQLIRVEPLVFFATYVVIAMGSSFVLLMTGHQQK